MSVQCKAGRAARARGAAGRLVPVSSLGTRTVVTTPAPSSMNREHREKLERTIANSLVHTLSQEHMSVASTVVPWYLRGFPSIYFNSVAESTRLAHLKGLAALNGIHQQSSDTDVSLSLTSKSDEPHLQDVTVIATDCRPGTLHRALKALRSPLESGELRRAQVYSSSDNTLSLTIFTYGTATDEYQAATLDDAEALLSQLSSTASDGFRDDTLFDFVSACSPSYLRNLSHRRYVRERKLFESVRGSEGADVLFSPDAKDAERMWLSMAAANVRPEVLLTKVTELLAVRGLNVLRMNFDLMRDDQGSVGSKPGSVSMISFLISPMGDEVSANDLESPFWQELARDLRRVKWLDQATLDLGLSTCPEMGLDRAEILTALCSMLHGPLSKLNPFAFSRPNLRGIVGNPYYSGYASDIADLFRTSFNPETGKPADFDEQVRKLQERIRALSNESARTVLLKMVDAVKHTKRTNLFVPNRCALALRVDADLMITADQESPFGVFFVHGENFDGFHNRFQNIARGGLRIVTPNSSDQFGIESSRCYDEVYGLSRAQQLKNKDIPEGGAKAVVLVNVTSASAEERYHVMRTSVKAFTDCLLDLIVTTAATRKHVVDGLGFDELVYLGPDEQVVPEDIDWIIGQAAKRGYPIPAAFMSSKPLAGINHKEYGVTSEGIAVFLEEALRETGVDPREQPYTIKITGGPDGDVAGNLMRILFRDHGKNVCVVGVADGSGVAEDPTGLDHSELMRLFREALPIGYFAASKLSPKGSVHLVGNEEGVRMRNSMHNRIKSDVFVPAGGRPNTIHDENWHEFLDSTGTPSSPLIVEGANIFLTAGARQGLFEKGKVMIVKDSSANKCGVITSSFEICASMLLEQSEFLEIKEELVQDVLHRLRELARLEANLMFREYRNYPGSLPQFSERISVAINRADAAIRGFLANMERGDEVYRSLLPLFTEQHLPQKLSEKAAGQVDRIPLDYLRNAFASCLSSKLVYREGINFIESQPLDSIAQLSLRYFSAEKSVERLLEKVGGSNTLADADREQVMRLLRRGGVRSLLRVF